MNFHHWCRLSTPPISPSAPASCCHHFLFQEFVAAGADRTTSPSGDDPYANSIQRNLDFLRGMIERNDFSRLTRKPVPLMPLPVA